MRLRYRSSYFLQIHPSCSSIPLQSKNSTSAAPVWNSRRSFLSPWSTCHHLTTTCKFPFWHFLFSTPFSVVPFRLVSWRFGRRLGSPWNNSVHAAPIFSLIWIYEQNAETFLLRKKVRFVARCRIHLRFCKAVEPRKAGKMIWDAEIVSFSTSKFALLTTTLLFSCLFLCYM